MVKFLQKLEDAIKANQGGFLGGDTPGAVDYILWPWIERIGAVKLLRPGIIIQTHCAIQVYNVTNRRVGNTFTTLYSVLISETGTLCTLHLKGIGQRHSMYIELLTYNSRH